MKKILGLAAVAVAASALVGTGSASATTVETTGVTSNESATITASGGPAPFVVASTSGASVNECTSSDLHWATVGPYTLPRLSAPVTTWALSSCSRPVTVHEPGSLSLEHISGTTNATLGSSGAVVTVGSPFGTLNCKTGEETHIGTFTGTTFIHATVHVNAVINCGFLVPSAVWSATYTVTSPTGVGYSA